MLNGGESFNNHTSAEADDSIGVSQSTNTPATTEHHSLENTRQKQLLTSLNKEMDYTAALEKEHQIALERASLEAPQNSADIPILKEATLTSTSETANHAPNPEADHNKLSIIEKLKKLGIDANGLNAVEIQEIIESVNEAKNLSEKQQNPEFLNARGNLGFKNFVNEAAVEASQAATNKILDTTSSQNPDNMV